MANYTDEVSIWLTSVTEGELYWDLAADGSRAARGTIQAVNEWGFVATVTGIWDSDAEEFTDQVPAERFYPWHAIMVIGRQDA